MVRMHMPCVSTIIVHGRIGEYGEMEDLHKASRWPDAGWEVRKADGARLLFKLFEARGFHLHSVRPDSDSPPTDRTPTPLLRTTRAHPVFARHQNEPLVFVLQTNLLRDLGRLGGVLGGDLAAMPGCKLLLPLLDLLVLECNICREGPRANDKTADHRARA